MPGKYRHSNGIYVPVVEIGVCSPFTFADMPGGYMTVGIFYRFFIIFVLDVCQLVFLCPRSRRCRVCGRLLNDTNFFDR